MIRSFAGIETIDHLLKVAIDVVEGENTPVEEENRAVSIMNELRSYVENSFTLVPNSIESDYKVTEYYPATMEDPEEGGEIEEVEIEFDLTVKVPKMLMVEFLTSGMNEALTFRTALRKSDFFEEQVLEFIKDEIDDIAEKTGYNSKTLMEDIDVKGTLKILTVTLVGEEVIDEQSVAVFKLHCSIW